jgi:hypothetical protein
MDRGVHTLADGSIFLHASCTELVPSEDAGEHGEVWNWFTLTTTVRHGLHGVRPGFTVALATCLG